MEETGAKGKAFFPNGDCDTRTILFVERSGRFRSSISTMLADKRYNVLEASTAHECLLTLEAHKPRIVLIGLNFAGHEVLSLTKTIKSSPRHSRTPVLLITSGEMTDSVADWKQAGITAWITEPVMPERLLRAIEMITF